MALVLLLVAIGLIIWRVFDLAFDYKAYKEGRLVNEFLEPAKVLNLTPILKQVSLIKEEEPYVRSDDKNRE